MRLLRKGTALALDLIFRVPCTLLDRRLARNDIAGCWTDIAPAPLGRLFNWSIDHSPLTITFPPPPWDHTAYNQLPKEASAAYFAAKQLFEGAWVRRRMSEAERAELLDLRDRVLGHILTHEGIPHGPARRQWDDAPPKAT
jgi:hypothetical protein